MDMDKDWRSDFWQRVEAMRGFFAGLNPQLAEEQQLRELLEEAAFMIAPLRVRLAEIEAGKKREAQHGNGD